MILVDTQVVVWMTMEPAKLSKDAVRALAGQRGSHGSVSIAGSTLWELAMLVTRKKILPDLPLSAYLKKVERLYTVLPVDAQIAERSMQFTKHFPKDPVDRIISATALVHQLSLITADGPIRQSGEVPCIW